MPSRWFVRGDIDGFFGLFVDNLLQLMLMVVLSGAVCGLPPSLILGRILPGAAVSILFGNLFYAWQAHKTGRPDATALPFGINTPSLLAYIFLIMGPVYQETRDPILTWRVGLFACLVSGVFEVLGAFAGDRLRRHTPRAALLSALAGIALTFISMGFVFQIFARPWIALLPMLLLLATYASRARLPFGIPGGLAAVIVGTCLAWI
jgi:AGZA family xanthine/uracil permease-like MFS transporter